MDSQQILRCFLIPFKGGQAVLPNSSMVEVLPFATPLKLENAPAWISGTMLWRAFNVPLISLEKLIEETPAARSYSRIIMINLLGHDPRFPYVGLLSTDAPRLLRLERSQIAVNQAVKKPSRLGILRWAIINGRETFIPDLDALESVLGPLIRQGE